MSEQDNIRTAEKLFDAINTHNVRTHDELYAPDYKLDGPGAAGSMNLEQSRMYLEGFLDAFPDLNFKLMKKIADGDMVAITWTATGTHTGPMRTPTGGMIPPTGKKGVVNGCTTYEFIGGKVASSATYWDMATLLMQLGLMPGM
jgi:steroid delta-isomerase-like uncharacterized protein